MAQMLHDYSTQPLSFRSRRKTGRPRPHIISAESDPIPTFRHRPICEQVSEIRLDGRRDRSVFFGTVFIRVFGADAFRPVKEDAPIGFARGPSCCEDALISTV